MVRTLQSARPRPELKEFVQCFALRDIRCEDTTLSQANIACLQQALSFEFEDRPTFDYPDGQSKRATKMTCFGSLTYPCGGTRFTGHIFGFAIFLTPLASWRLFRIPPGVLATIDCDSQSLLGQRMSELWTRLSEGRTFADRIRIAEAFLMPLAVNALHRTAVMKSAQFLCDHNGAMRIDGLANHCTLSVRQYERRFREEIGLTPKLFARTARFASALDAKRISPKHSWLRIAHNLGYADQMHMVRDFQSLGGFAPGQLLQQSGDLQPWSIGSSVGGEKVDIDCGQSSQDRNIVVGV